MKTFKRVISLLLVASLMMFTVPVAFAADNTSAVAETEEEDILDNPIFSGAIKDIVVAFVESFAEILQRYVEVIKALIASIELPEITLPDTGDDVTPEVPDTGDEDVTTPDAGEEDVTTPDAGEESGNEAA